MTAMLAEPPPDRPVLQPVEPETPDDDLSVDELGARIVGLSGRLAAATCRWLLLVARFDAAEGWRAFGLPSTARWLSFSCGLAHRTAVEHVRVARALHEFPSLVEEMSAGRLSYTQVRAVSRVPKDGEHGVTADLINVAKHSTASQLEAIVRGMRSVEQVETGVPPKEYLSASWSGEAANAGQWRLHARLDAEHGAVVAAALEQVARVDGGLSQVEALVRLAEIGLAALADSEHPPRPLRGHERAAVVVHVDAADVPEPAGESPEPFARVAGGPGLSPSTTLRLLCEGRVRTVLLDGDGTVMDVGRARRTVTERQYRALLIRHDGHCAHPGCASTSGMEAHHVVHWLHGGRTDMANLVLLCRVHHHKLHDHEFGIEALGRGRFTFRRADGGLLEAHVDPGEVVGPEPTVEQEHSDVAPTAATPEHQSERLDRHYAVSVLAQRRELRRRN